MENLKTAPIVSVLMTVYNREKYIRQAIESVLASSLRDFELVIVDDGSSDRSVEIAQSYAERDTRVRVHINQKNLGDYPNRNRAASLARGKYLKYVDADDMIYPHGLQILVETMDRFPEAGYGLCSLEQDARRIYPFELEPKAAYNRHYFEQDLFHKAPLSAIIRKDAFEAVGGFSGKQHVGDFEMWHMLSARFPVVLMPHGMVWYREHDEQQMQDNRTNVAVPFKYLKLAVDMLRSEDCPLPTQGRKAAEHNLLRQQARTILRATWKYGPAKGAELLRLSNIAPQKLLVTAMGKRREAA